MYSHAFKKAIRFSTHDTSPFVYAQFGRAILFMAFMFLSLAILQLANQQAGCPRNENGSYTNCGNTVYGLQPSSMLALMAMIGGIATSLFMPYAGAVVDYSDRRRGFGKVCATLLVLVNFVQIFIFESTWFAMTILQAVVASAAFMANAMVLWSYVSAPNDHILHGITASGRNWEVLGMLIFFIIVGVVQFASGWDSVTLARFSQALASFAGGVSLFLAYKRYPAVKAVKKLEEGKSLWIAGASEFFHTAINLRKTEPGAARYLLAVSFLAGAIGSFTNLVITYLSEELEMSSTGIIIFILINMVIQPAGVLIHRTSARRVGHKKNYLMVISFFVILTALFIGLIAGPDQMNWAYLFSVLYGVAYGWYYPSSNGFFVSLVPEELVTELWGFNMFASVILSWVPPLIFTTLNETTGNLRLGIIGILAFLLAGFCIVLFIPEKKSDAAEDDDEEKGSIETPPPAEADGDEEGLQDVVVE
jgi:UMF1 family MFS transporter